MMLMMKMISIILALIFCLITLKSADAATNPNFSFTIDGKLYNSSSLMLNQSTVQGDAIFLNATDSQKPDSAVLFKDAIALHQNTSTTTNNRSSSSSITSLSSFSTEFTISVDLTELYSVSDFVFAMSPLADLELAYKNSYLLQGNLGFELLFITDSTMTGSLQQQRVTYFQPQGYAYGVQEFDFLGSGTVATVANLSENASTSSLHTQLCQNYTNSSSSSSNYTDQTLTLTVQVSALYNSTKDNLQVGFTTCTDSVLQVLLPVPWSNLAASMADATGNTTTMMTYLGFLAISGSFNVSMWQFDIDPSSVPAALNSSHYTSRQSFLIPDNGDYGNDNYGPGIGMFHYRGRGDGGSTSTAYVIGFSVAAAVVVVLAAATVVVVICRRRYRAKRISSRQIHAVPDRRPGSDAVNIEGAVSRGGSGAGSIAMQSLAVAPSTLTATSDTLPLNPVISRSPSFSEMDSGWLRPVAPR